MRSNGIDRTFVLFFIKKDTGVIVICFYLLYGESVGYLSEIFLDKLRNLNAQEFGYSLYFFAAYEDIAAGSIATFPLALSAGLRVESEVEALFLDKLLFFCHIMPSLILSDLDHLRSQ